MITSSYFKKHKKHYRSLKDQQLTIAAKANIFICIMFCLFWTIYFAFAQMWVIVYMDICFTLISIFSFFSYLYKPYFGRDTFITSGFAGVSSRFFAYFSMLLRLIALEWPICFYLPERYWDI